MEAVEDFSVGLRDAFHYPKVNANRYERQTASALDGYGNLWAAISYEEGGQRLVALRAVNPSGATVYEGTLSRERSPSRPLLQASPEGGIAAVWVEVEGGVWRMMYGEKHRNEDGFSVSVVHQGGDPCLQPALCFVGGRPQVAWSGRCGVDGSFAIWMSRRVGSLWMSPSSVSGDGGHCFRPTLCGEGEWLFIAWDRGRDGRQTVDICEIDIPSGERRDHSLSRESERLIRPSLAVSEGIVSIACIAIVDVRDGQLGITDHRTGIAFARLQNGRIEVREGWIADLNEGLLGIKTYVPYFGIRRRCALTTGKAGEIWLTWEMRFESEEEEAKADPPKGRISVEHYGYLVGQKLAGSGWGRPVILHRGGISYSVAANSLGRFGATFLEESDVFVLPELRQEFLDEGGFPPFESRRDGEGRWSARQERIVGGPRYTVTVRDEKLGLHWGDTHVHSNFSPDAEGEPDELILFGRDIAALDFMAMVDNDYYPHAGLMRMEWEVQQALAETFTRPGEFVVFPGFEFTYHDRKLSPNFNHRYILYPRRGELFSRLDPRTRSLEDLAGQLAKYEVIMVAHHANWMLCGAVADRYVEICSSWRISMEEKNFIVDHLRKGERFAFIGSSDSHRSCPGLGGALTGVYSGGLDPESLFEGYRKRRTIATQGQRIAIDFRIDELFIGDSGTISARPELRLIVDSPVDLEYIQICRDGSVIKHFDGKGRLFSIECFDDAAGPGTHFYFVRVKTVGDPSYNEEDSDKDRASGPFVRRGRFPFNFARAQGPFAWTTPTWADIK